MDISILQRRFSGYQEDNRDQISQIHMDNQPEQQVVSIKLIIGYLYGRKILNNY
jgi:hypothetical protein